MTTAYVGHIVAVEADIDGGRYWRTFDATKPETRVEVSAKAGEYIARLAADGELSDIDCGTGCPCLAPTMGCEGCAALSFPGYRVACIPCRDAYSDGVAGR